MKFLRYILFFTLSFPFFLEAHDWTPPFPLFKEHIEKEVFSLSINQSGDTIIGFYNPKNEIIEFARYNFINDETEVMPVDFLPCAQGISSLKIVVDNKGNIFALWMERGSQTLKAACFHLLPDGMPYGKWSEIFEVSANELRNPSIVCDQKGNTLIVWEEHDDFDFQIKTAAYFNQKSQWSQVFTISSAGYDCHSSKVDIDSTGKAIVVWSARSHLEQDQVEGIRAVRVELNPLQFTEIFSFFESAFSLKTPDVAIDSHDHIHLIWQRKEKRTGSKKIQSFSISSDLVKKGNIRDLSGENTYDPTVIRMGEELYAFWKTTDGSSEWIQTRRLKEYNSDIKNITTPISKIEDYIVDSDDCCKLRVVYFNSRQIYAAILDEEWTNVEILSEQSGHSVEQMQIDSDSIGNALITWLFDDRIFYSLGDYLRPPKDLNVQKVEKRFPAKVVIRALLTWSPSHNPTVVGYRIRRNNVILADVAKADYVDARCPRGVSLYTVSSINRRGHESQVSRILFNN